MAAYRIYWFGADGHISAAQNLECSSDDQARARARDLVGEFQAAEVWNGRRRVVRLRAQDKISSLARLRPDHGG
jgi:hypothetical protein